jgi:hypothetical protein
LTASQGRAKVYENSLKTKTDKKTANDGEAMIQPEEIEEVSDTAIGRRDETQKMKNTRNSESTIQPLKLRFTRKSVDGSMDQNNAEMSKCMLRIK